MVQQARVAHVVASPFGHIADIHAATKRQNGQQQNQATHPILQRPVTENRRMAVGCRFCAIPCDHGYFQIDNADL
jgi:NAD-dependent dihydropyrimidine dehydrogenase PreA subunit